MKQNRNKRDSIRNFIEAISNYDDVLRAEGKIMTGYSKYICRSVYGITKSGEIRYPGGYVVPMTEEMLIVYKCCLTEIYEICLQSKIDAEFLDRIGCETLNSFGHKGKSGLQFIDKEADPQNAIERQYHHRNNTAAAILFETNMEEFLSMFRVKKQRMLFEMCCIYGMTVADYVDYEEKQTGIRSSEWNIYIRLRTVKKKGARLALIFMNRHGVQL